VVAGGQGVNERKLTGKQRDESDQVTGHSGLKNEK